MCLSIPGKVSEIKKNRFVIDYEGKRRIVNISVIEDLKIGDYVIVANKIIVNKIPKEEAIKYLGLINKSGENDRN